MCPYGEMTDIVNKRVYEDKDDRFKDIGFLF